jgi:hypothetical protein
MKDPTTTHCEIEPMEDEYVCCIDDTPWPCKTVRKWRRSKDFKIAELQTLTDSLAKDNARLGSKSAELQRELRKTNVVQQAMLDWLRSIDIHGQFEIVTSVEETDVSTFSSLGESIPGVKTFKVRYGGENGEWRS